VGNVAVEDLLGNLQVALIKDLLEVTPEAGLVLFSGHVSLLLPELPLPLGRAVAPLRCCQLKKLGASLAKVYSTKCLEGEFSEVRQPTERNS
jgi:hypothetical protein